MLRRWMDWHGKNSWWLKVSDGWLFRCRWLMIMTIRESSGVTPFAQGAYEKEGKKT
jgi:hypothetical protein